ncbi:hypothetical protein C8R44DRAFT_883259 [Mycena epipterygia]|nr:hypothetical protein C8R44DRAFT_883259 [Mycena epipterygia]
MSNRRAKSLAVSEDRANPEGHLGLPSRVAKISWAQTSNLAGTLSRCSPFNTGNDTFGLSSQYKRAAAIGGDLDFLSQRRFWIETATNAGVPAFGYLFTQPQPGVAPSLGVYHSSEVAFVYGAPSDTSASAVLLSEIMVEYGVSFTISLTPNDGLGIPHPEWTQFTPENEVSSYVSLHLTSYFLNNLLRLCVIQLNGANLTMIPDDFRAEQTDFINSDPVIWRH